MVILLKITDIVTYALFHGTNIVVFAGDDLKWLFPVVNKDFKAVQVSLCCCQVGRGVSNLVLAVGVNLLHPESQSKFLTL